ncbi:NMCC_0638 family (lipo)protein [Magnetospirillum molischianum]|uniref:Uncharacterized protein n=1 Tax=Magnetospirillum molischianum DSM 120 TaxID=1150626 RepID=H8FT50_MAGML|nr:hypothetical protein [Magnetospirillum molischianum]CCG41538.1 conserved exported hypothetical protein [Magnetospirillum molischianum DSM 120]
MRQKLVVTLLALLCSAPALAQTAPVLDPAIVRDQTSRLATAVLGQICLLNIGDTAAALAAAAPGGEFGFIEAPPDVAKALLGERNGNVRVLRRAGLGVISVVIPQDGQCSVMAEFADAAALRRHLDAMIERGGLKDGGSLLPLDTREMEGMTLTDYVFNPTGWFAKILAKRFGTDGSAPVALVTLVSPPGRAAMEAVLSVRLSRDTK